ncbi:hypothetical protein [Vibrio splendidus]|uniref:hypothetical protein n=1 Tax=Vibrio splendidus TaxID=29497 RepID=UPI0030D9C4E9
MTQEQYWRELYALKTHISFIELEIENAVKIDRRLKVILAIASSTSIGGWAIWQSYSMIWATVIAASQVITAITPLLPYKTRIKQYSALLGELESLMVHAEFKWNSIASGKLTNEEINKSRFEIASAKQKSIKKHIQTTITTNVKSHRKAELAATEYFELYYNI